MSLKSRVKRVEKRDVPPTGHPFDIIYLCSLHPNRDEDGNPIEPGSAKEAEPRMPACALIVMGPLAGDYVSSEEGETYEEFVARVDRLREEAKCD